MHLIKWDPFKELEEIRDFFEDRTRSLATTPKVNIYEENGKFNVEAMLPSFDPEEVEVNVTDEKLEINAQHKEEKEEKGKKYLKRESASSSYYRQIALPNNLDTSKAKATYKNGVLTVSIPTVELPKPKRLKIETSKEKK